MDVNALLSWFWENRRILPWRCDRTPYSTWISEAMLQQTRVATVLDYYPRFLSRFPDPKALATASEDEVLKVWEGLGYYSRAKNLMKGAAYICENYNGDLPSDPDLLIRIPGIGPYMTGAISSLAFGKAVPAVDGNVIRIYCRLYSLPLIASEGATFKEIYKRANADIPEENPGDFNEALMDLGATVCTPRSPKCTICPFSNECSAFLLGKQEDFPVKKQKKEVPVEEHTILKIFLGEKILVRKRPDKGLLSGLYEFIDLTGTLSEKEVEKWASDLFGQKKKGNSSDPFTIRPLGGAHHIFSHLRWNMTGYEIHLPAKKDAEKAARTLGDLVSQKEYEALAFPSALRAYR